MSRKYQQVMDGLLSTRFDLGVLIGLFVAKHMSRVTMFSLADRTRLFVQYTISSSSLCKLIWRHWTICGAVCFQCTHFRCDDWENIYTLSCYHHQIESMNHYPFFRAMPWKNGVHCMSFYIHINPILWYKSRIMHLCGCVHVDRSD